MWDLVLCFVKKDLLHQLGVVHEDHVLSAPEGLQRGALILVESAHIAVEIVIPVAGHLHVDAAIDGVAVDALPHG